MIQNRRETEKNIIAKMIMIYCRGNKHEQTLCDKCKELVDYAQQRIDACKYGEQKTFCSKCTVHCFKPDKREEVRKVMRYSGKRIIFYHPVMAIKHLLKG